MLERIPISYSMIQFLATDTINGSNYKKKLALRTLTKYEDDSSMIAGLQKIINIKIGAKVMLQRNIDMTIGLVNGAVGKIKDVVRNADQGCQFGLFFNSYCYHYLKTIEYNILNRNIY